MVRRILIAVAALAALALPATASASAITARSSGVTATFRYVGRLGHYRDQTLTIRRAGRIVYRHAVTYKLCGRDCGPSFATHQPAVQVLDLGRVGTPDVLLNLFTGGAHCCSVLEVFGPAPHATRYREIASRDFGDPGYRLAKLGGRHAFVTANDAFAYAFTDFAASGLPLQILRLNGGRFSDITRAYPSLVRRDAARWLSLYAQQVRHRSHDTVGLIAAWAADEYTLGRSRPALRYLDGQARAGHLNSALNRSESGMTFVAKLKAFLLKHGYGR